MGEGVAVRMAPRIMAGTREEGTYLTEVGDRKHCGYSKYRGHPRS